MHTQAHSYQILQNFLFGVNSAKKTLSTNENNENKNKENTLYIATASRNTHIHISPIYTPYVYNLGKWLCTLRRCFRCY